MMRIQDSDDDDDEDSDDSDDDDDGSDECDGWTDNGFSDQSDDSR